MAWISFSALPCRKKKTWWQLAPACCCNRARRSHASFSLYNKKRIAIRHTDRPLFPTTLSIPSYDIEKWVGLRTYQHPFVCSHGTTRKENIQLHLVDIKERLFSVTLHWLPFGMTSTVVHAQFFCIPIDTYGGIVLARDGLYPILYSVKDVTLYSV